MTPPSDQWLTEALATRHLDRIQPNMAAAGERVNDARRHVRSARVIAADDPTLAIAACHDAIRKAITAHMAAAGLRPRSGDGAHRVVLEYARQRLAEVITADDLAEADDIRRDRVLAEYGDFASRQIDADHVRAAADAAERIVNAVAREPRQPEASSEVAQPPTGRAGADADAGTINDTSQSANRPREAASSQVKCRTPTHAFRLAKGNFPPNPHDAERPGSGRGVLVNRKGSRRSRPI